MLNLAKGESVEDLKVLESNEGFCRRECRELECRWHKEKKRVKGKAFIPLRRMLVRLPKCHPSFDLLIEIRRKIGELIPVPT